MIVFAHRGASGSAPDNSVRAFDLAIDLGTNAIESDARVTIDGKLVFFHDWAVKLSGKAWFPVSLLPSSRMLAMDLGDGQRVPLVSDIFSHFRKRGNLDAISWSIDIAGNRAFKQLLDTARAFSIERNVFACFERPDPFLRWKRAAPSMHMVWSIRGHAIKDIGTRGIINVCKSNGVDVLNLKVSEAYPDLVEETRAEGLRVFIWDVHDKQRYDAALAYRPDAIYTNYPEKVLGGSWNGMPAKR